MTKSFFFTVSLAAVTCAPAYAQGWDGYVGTGLFSSARTSTDIDIVGSPFSGLYVEGQAQRDFGGYRFSIDGRAEFIDDKGVDDVYETGPLHSGVVGLHFGREFGPAYVGGFAALGMFDGFDSEAPMTGTLVGLEGSYAVGSTTELYAQLGALRAIGLPGDNEYVGHAGRVGVNYAANDRFSLGLSYEFGRSYDCFVDCGNEPGEFGMGVIDLSYAITDRFDIVGRYSVNWIHDYDDPDTGTDNSLYVGVRYNIGGSSSRTALTTPMGGFAAAGWMLPLD